MSNVEIDRVALRFPVLGAEGGNLQGTRPVVIFADQGQDPAGKFGSGSLGGTGELTIGGLANLSAPTAHLTAHQGQPMHRLDPLRRVIFIVDGSGSMNSNVSSGIQQRKIDHIAAAIQGLPNNFVPQGTKISLISFDDTAVDMLVGQNLSDLKSASGKLWKGGGTNFVDPLELAQRIIEEDNRYTKSLYGRSLVVFLTDGQDGHQPKVLTLARDLRRLNAATFMVGIGEDYSMERIVELSSLFGFSGWSHSPMLKAGIEPFSVLIPRMITELTNAEFYLRLRASGNFKDLWGITPSLKPSFDKRKFNPGYARESAAILFEQRDNLRLLVKAGLHVGDKDASKLEIPICDIDDSQAAVHFERLELAREYLFAKLKFDALRARDVQLLEIMLDQHPEKTDELQAAIDAIKDLKKQGRELSGTGTHLYYSGMTEVGSVSVADFIRPRQDQGSGGETVGASARETVNDLSRVPAAPKKQPARQPFRNVADHSGGLGPLSMSAPNSLPIFNAAAPQAYQLVCPQNAPRLVFEVAGVPVELDLRQILDGGSWKLGRSAGCDIVIDQPLISKNHLLITRIGNKFFIQDLTSTNGTFLNSEKLIPAQQIELKDQDVILLPKKKLRLKFLAPTVH